MYIHCELIEMQAKIQKWGNSAGIRLNKSLLDEINSAIGDAVEVEALGGEIVIKPRTELTLEELLSKSPDGCFALLQEDKAWLDTRPIGKEV